MKTILMQLLMMIVSQLLTRENLELIKREVLRLMFSDTHLTSEEKRQRVIEAAVAWAKRKLAR